MTTYAKLTEDKQLDVLRYIPQVSNPKEATWDAYAAEHGYKPLLRTNPPNPYYTSSYKETDKAIEQVWAPWSLQQAQEAALATIQEELDSARQQRVTVPCEGLPNGIFCDPDARMMATGLVAMGSNIPADMTWTDAADEVHPLTVQLLNSIAAAFVEYLLGAQHAADAKRKAVKEAGSVDEVWAVVSTPPHNSELKESPEKDNGKEAL